MHPLYRLKILGPIVYIIVILKKYISVLFLFYFSLIRDDEDEENVDTDWIMTIKQADNDLKKQLMNGDKTPDQVNNKTNGPFFFCMFNERKLYLTFFTLSSWNLIIQ